jgi:hypothetical protein
MNVNSTNKINNYQRDISDKKNDNNLDDYELLIVRGEDHKTGNENDIEERHNFLEAWAK